MLHNEELENFAKHSTTKQKLQLLLYLANFIAPIFLVITILVSDTNQYIKAVAILFTISLMYNHYLVMQSALQQRIMNKYLQEEENQNDIPTDDQATNKPIK